MFRTAAVGIVVAGILVCTASLHAAGQSRSAQTRRLLDQPLPASVTIDFSKGVAIRDAVDYLREISGANFHVNWKAIEAAGIPADTTVNFRLRNVSLRKVLNMIMSEAGGTEQSLAFYIDDGIIEVTTKEIADSIQYTVVYPVEDLLVESPENDPQMQMMGMMGMSMGMGGGGGGGGRRGGGGGYGGGRSGGGYGGGGYGGGYGGGGYGGGYGGGMMGGYGGGMMGGYGGGMMGGMGGMGMMGGMGGMGMMGGYGGYGSTGTTGTGTGTSNSNNTQAGRSGNELVDLIKAVIYPKYWEDEKASIKFYKGNLIITAPRVIHEAIGGPID